MTPPTKVERIELQELKALISVGVEQALRGQVMPFDLDAIQEKGRKRLRETSKSKDRFE